MQLSMIVAMDLKCGIGKDGDIPWHIPEDMKFFKEKTLGKPCIMGRKTFENIVKVLGKPLPNRLSIVLTKDPVLASRNSDWTNVCYSRNASDALYAARTYYDVNPDDTGIEDVMVVGGAEVYGLMLPFVDTAYITVIDQVFDTDAHIQSVMAEIAEQFNVSVLKCINRVAPEPMTAPITATIHRATRELPADLRDIVTTLRT